MICFSCECGQQLQAPEESAGQGVVCPTCQRQLTVPAQSAASELVQREPLSRHEPAFEVEPEIDDRLQSQPLRGSRKAVVSLILGVFSLFCNVLAGLPALLLGIWALRDISRSGGRLSGQGLAIAGIVAACACTLLSCVIAVPVGIGILVPAVQKIREAAVRAESMNNLKQIALAMHAYHDANHGRFPAAAICDKNGKPLLSWRVAILPYIGQEPLYRQFKLDEPWDSPHNIQLLGHLVKTYRSPGDMVTPPDHTHYQVFVGNGAAFDKTRRYGMPDFRDGLSNTVLIVEADKAVP